MISPSENGETWNHAEFWRTTEGTKAQSSNQPARPCCAGGVEAIVQPARIARPVYAPVFFSVLRTCVGKSRAPSKGAILKRCQEPAPARGRIGSLGNRDILQETEAGEAGFRGRVNEVGQGAFSARSNVLRTYTKRRSRSQSGVSSRDTGRDPE